MKILFVGAYEKGGARNRFYAPQLGLERMAGFLRKKGHYIDIFDPNFEFAEIDDNKEKEFETFKKTIENKDYKIIGFHTTDWTLPFDIELIEWAKKIYTTSIMVVGGQEATFNYKEILKNSLADVIIRGEGEKPIEELISKIEAGLDIKNPVNLVRGGAIYDKERDRCYVKPNPQLTQEEFNEITLGMDFSRIPYERYWFLTEKLIGERSDKRETRTIRLFTTNFCPHRCTFCSSTNFHDSAAGLRKNDNFLNIENPEIALGSDCSLLYSLNAKDLYRHVLDAIKSHPDVNNILLQDDEFVLIKPRVLEFCELIIKGKKNKEFPEHIAFMCQSRIDDMNEELLKPMSEANFKLIGYGVESFSQKILNAVRKKIKVENINEIIDLTLKYNITPFINLIIFFPQADKEDIIITIKNAFYWLEKGCQVAIEPYLMPLAGAEITSQGFDIFYKEFSIGDKKFKKGIFFIPYDTEVKKAALLFREEIDKVTSYFISKYKLKFSPTRLRSLFIIFTVSKLFGEKETCQRVGKYLDKIL